MSVQSNSGSGGSLEATPSWSQLSSSPTISQQHLTATAKSKEGICVPQVHGRLVISVKCVLCGRTILFRRCWACVCWRKMDVKFTDAVNWKPNVSCQFSWWPVEVAGSYHVCTKAALACCFGLYNCQTTRRLVARRCCCINSAHTVWTVCWRSPYIKYKRHLLAVLSTDLYIAAYINAMHADAAVNYFLFSLDAAVFF